MNLQKKEQLTEQISRLQDSVKRKYNAFKQGTLESDRWLEKQYKPLINELRKTGNIDYKIKQEVKSEDSEGEGYEYDEGGNLVDSFQPNVHSSTRQNSTLVSNASRIDNEEDVYGDPLSEDEITDHITSNEGVETASRFIDNTFQHELTRKYMLKMMKDLGGHKNTIDHVFGPRYEDKTLMVGDSPLSFDEDGSIRVNDVKYRPTGGLYELLFKRLPDDMIFTKDDLNAYKNILQTTNAHKVNYNNHARIRRDNSLKYQHIIRKLFPPRQQVSDLYSGKGNKRTVTKNFSAPDTSRCGDPDDMTDRLALLVTSAEVGNKGHKNEIINIIDSLKKDGIISGNGNRRYWDLLQ